MARIGKSRAMEVADRDPVLTHTASMRADLDAAPQLASPSPPPLAACPTAGAAQNAPLRVLLVASAGGHWIELTRVAEAFSACDCQFVSTAPGLKAPLGDRPMLTIADSSRDTLATMLMSFRSMWRIVSDFQPDFVVSTGAAPGALALLVAKLRGARTIWIDSIANCDGLSMSGRAVRPIADLRLTQWPHLSDDKKRLTYYGQVL